MAGETNEVSIAFEAELGRFESGIKKAETMLKQSGTRLEAIAKDNAKKISKAMSQAYITRSFQPYGVMGDSSFGDKAAAQQKLMEEQQRRMLKNAEIAEQRAEALMMRRERRLAEFARKSGGGEDGFPFGGGMRAMKGLLHVQLIRSGFTSLRALTSAIQGDWEKTREHLESFPLGIGQAIASMTGFVDDIANAAVGMKSINAEFNEVGKKAAELMATKGARDSARDLLASLRATGAADAATDPQQKERILVEEARRRAEIEREEMERAGVDAKTAAAIFAETMLAETKRISQTISAEAERTQLERMRKDQAIEKADAEMRKGVEIRKAVEQAAQIQKEIESRKSAEDNMRDEMSSLQGVRGSNFVRSISTAMGSFSFGQAGGAQEVGRAQIRSAELLSKINDNIKRMAELEEQREGLLSLR